MNSYRITKFETWVLKRIAKRIVTQGFYHTENIETYYGIIKEAAEIQFTEDNKPTLDGFLEDCFNNGTSSSKD